MLEAMEMKDPVAVLREQLQEAKNNKVLNNLIGVGKVTVVTQRFLNKSHYYFMRKRNN